MTDPTTVTPDEVEDRLRRTFAARAEDMTPGDAGELPDLRLDEHPGRRRRRHLSRRPLQAAAAVTLVAMAAAGAVIAARGAADDDTGHVATVSDQPPADEVLAVVTAPRALVTALQVERDMATVTLIGQENAVAFPATDTGHARRETDEAMTAFEELVNASPAGAAYRPAVGDTVEALDELRADIDANVAPRTMANGAAARSVFDRYAGIVGGLLDAQESVSEPIDDPELHAGALAYGTGLRLDELTAHLGRVTALTGVVPGGEPTGELRRFHAEARQGLDSLVAETAGTPYEEAAATAVSEIEGAGLLEAIETGLAGSVDLATVMSATDLATYEIWPAYLDRVEEALATES